MTETSYLAHPSPASSHTLAIGRSRFAALLCLPILGHAIFFSPVLRVGHAGLASFLFMIWHVISVPLGRNSTVVLIDASLAFIVVANICYNPASIAVDIQIGMAILIAWMFASRGPTESQVEVRPKTKLAET